MAVKTDGRREIIGLGIGPSEAETFWTEFLRGLSAGQSWRHVADQVRARWPKLAALMDDSEADVLASMSFPASTAPPTALPDLCVHRQDRARQNLGGDPDIVRCRRRGRVLRASKP